MPRNIISSFGAVGFVLVVVASSLMAIGAPVAAAASGVAVPSAPAFTIPAQVHAATSYPVTFSEVGLPANLNWQITVGRTTEVYSTDGQVDSLTFTEASGTYAYSIANLPGWQQSNLSYTGNVVVSGAAVTEPFITYSPVTYAINFTESGLPASLTWQVTVGGTPESLTTDGGTDSLVFQEPNGTLSYAITDISGWNQVTLAYSGHITVSGAAIAEPTLAYTQVTYSVSFGEMGLPGGLTWQVTVNGVLKSLTTTGGTNTLTWTGLPNGTYPYSVAPVSGWVQSTLPATGNVVVNGGSVSEATLVYSKVTYTVVFSEMGLPSGLVWQVKLGPVSEQVLTDGGNDSISFTDGNGTYAYAISVVSGWEQFTLPSAGNVVVSGASVNETTVVYTQVTYSVTFTETGLPGGTNWSVTLGGTPMNSTTSQIVFTEPNGSYHYTIGIVSGYVPGASSGSKSVNGASVSVSVAFTQVKYAVTFTESGLPSGTSWGVTLGSLTTTTSTSIVFQEPNGTYGYTLSNVSGWVPPHHTGTVVVSGAPVPVAVPFLQVRYTLTFTETGLPTRGIYDRWSVAVDGILQSSTGTSIVFPEGNGTHNYVIYGPLVYEVSATLPPSGSITISAGSATQPVMFLRGPTSAISFHEVGLTLGSRWCATVGYQLCSTLTVISFRNLTPGSYPYAIGAVPGMITVVHLGVPLVGSTGTTSVTPARLFQVRYTFPVTFTETGLPSSTLWKVASGGILASSTTSTNVIDLINATYAFSVVRVTGFVASPVTGRFHVAGAPISIAIHFTAAPARPAATSVTPPDSPAIVGRWASVRPG